MSHHSIEDDGTMIEDDNDNSDNNNDNTSWADNTNEWSDNDNTDDDNTMDDHKLLNESADDTWGDELTTNNTIQPIQSNTQYTTLLAQRTEPYQILDEALLDEKRNELVHTTSEMLFVTIDEGESLLRHYGWKSKKLQSDWFNDSNNVRQQVGLTEDDNKPQPVIVNGMVQCQTAYCGTADNDDNLVPLNDAYALNCGHYCM